MLGLRVSASRQHLGVYLATDRSVDDDRETPADETRHEGLGLPRKLALTERAEAKVLRSSGQALLDLLHLQEVRRTSDRELTGCLVPVDTELDLGDQLRDTLHLVERDRRPEPGDEAGRVGGRRCADRLGSG